MTELSKQQADLANVLRYARELININAKVLSDIDSLKFPRFYDYQLNGLEGVAFNAGDDSWVTLKRLKESPPPAPPTTLVDWVKPERHPSPDKQPALFEKRVVMMRVEEIDALIELGTLDKLDVLPRPDGEVERPALLEVIQRSANMPELLKAWKEYLEGPWAKWAEVEKPRRHSIHVYNQLYHTHQQMQSMGVDNPIELVSGIGIARWQHETGRINCALVEQLLEVELLENGTLTLRPRPTYPVVNMAPFHAAEIVGSKQLQADANGLLKQILDDPDIGFSPFEKRSYEKILRMCFARISSDGIYLPDEESFDRNKPLPTADIKLQVSDTWIIYVRQRQENDRGDDILRLIKQVETAPSLDDLPPAARKFVEPPGDTAVEDVNTVVDLDQGIVLPTGPAGKAKGSSSGTKSRSNDKPTAENDYFFPLPYNDDQMEIVQLLEKHEGVLVQGPPGTGKTHTIANIICHYLAKGKRVLVTAYAPEALTALQEKIPESIRSLAISVIHNDRDGNAQLERAVRLLSDEIKNYRTADLDRDIQDGQARLVSIIKQIEETDRQLEAIADLNHRDVNFRGGKVSPMELARTVFTEKDRHGWFEDALTLENRHDVQFADADIVEIRTLRDQLGSDLGYSLGQLPDPTGLPDLPEVMKAHAELTRIKDIDRQTTGRRLPPMAAHPDAAALAQTLSSWLKDFTSFIEAARAEEWILSAYHKFIGVKPATEPTKAILKRAMDQWSDLATKAELFMLKGIVLPIPTEEVDAFDKAISELAQGKQPFGMFSFFKGGLKTSLDAITIGGRKPQEREDWTDILDYRIWQKAVVTFAKHWNSVSAAVGTKALADDFESVRIEIVTLRDVVGSVATFVGAVEKQRAAIKVLFPFGIDVDGILHHGDCALLIEAVQLNVEKADLASAQALKDRLKAIAGSQSLPFFSAVREFVANLGNGEIEPEEMGDAWKSIAAEAQRLHRLSDTIVKLEALVTKISASGAPAWAKRLRWEDVGPTNAATLTPLAWREAWEWTRAHDYVNSLADRERTQKLNRTRKVLEDERRKVFLEVVRLRTFLGLKQRITPNIEAALAQFVSAINRLGRGTGITASRFRRIIREATGMASQAVPCWIMPQWRISEQLPAELSAFDLVIIDESSQSDVTALPAIMRAKKLLVVGDDKQVSPTPIGIETRKITQLMMTYLDSLPFKDQMDPATSLYELGGMIFPGKTVMLREHFRCVEPIIRFSSRFYPKPLIPLRIPKASERLDPPLVDIYVPHGLRDRRKCNKAEAEVIVDEIEKLVADQAYAKRSIGVISLLGSEQARLIYEMLLEEIGSEAMERHHLMCGDAATFQGQERDIIFLSMVTSPDSAISQTARLYEQRYNVAMSRARDRLYLVRSVTQSDLKDGDLKLRVLEHFRNPMGQANVIRPDNILDLCDSGFERDVGERLIDIGYRITPQYPISGYRIDFVIEGAEDRRLAVELDGDQYHGPDRWREDIARQRSLERLGWKFWRCWGSQWLADPEGCLADLIETLKGMGIEPMGAAPVAGIYTQHIEVPLPEQASGAEATVKEIIETAEAALELGAAVGDLVVLSYIGEENRQLRYKLTAGASDLPNGILSISEPLGTAILGARVDDEVPIMIGQTERRLIILALEKAEATVTA